MIYRITNLKTEKVGPKLWKLTGPLMFATPSGMLSVPTGFITDGASSPQIFYMLCAPMSGRHAEAAVLHDYLYSRDSSARITKEQADKIFYRAMLDNGTSKATACLIYKAVSVAGGSSFKKMYSNEKLEAFLKKEAESGRN